MGLLASTRANALEAFTWMRQLGHHKTHPIKKQTKKKTHLYLRSLPSPFFIFIFLLRTDRIYLPCGSRPVPPCEGTPSCSLRSDKNKGKKQKTKLEFFQSNKGSLLFMRQAVDPDRLHSFQ